MRQRAQKISIQCLRGLIAALGIAFVAGCANEDTSVEAQEGSTQESRKVEYAAPVIDVVPEIEQRATKQTLPLTIAAEYGRMGQTNNGLPIVELADTDLLRLQVPGQIDETGLSAELESLGDEELADSLKIEVVDGEISIRLGESVQSRRAYRLQVRYSVDGKKRSQSLTLFRPAQGVIGMVFLDWDGDGDAERVALTADARIDFGSEDGDALPILGLESISAFTSGDFDRDGRAELALLGRDALGAATLALVKPHLQHQHGFRIESLPAGVSMPTDLVAVDLFRDGNPDLVALGFEGAVSVFHNAHGIQPGVSFSSLQPDFSDAIQPFATHLCSTLDDDDFLADLLVCGANEVQVLHGEVESESGLVFHPELSASTDSLRLGRNAFGRAVLGGGLKLKHLPAYVQDVGELDNAPVAALLAKEDTAKRFSMAYQDGTTKALHVEEFGALSQQIWELESIGTLNAIVSNAPQSALFLCCDSGVYQLDWRKADAKPRLSFNSQVRFDKPKLLAVLPPNMRSRALADMNHDGRVDVVGVYEDEDGQRLLGIWENRVEQGEGLVLLGTYAAEDLDEALPVDLNDDGLLDILLASRVEGRSKVLKADPISGRLEEENSYLTEVPRDLLGTPLVMDLNGDSFSDVIWPTKRLHVSFGSACKLSRPQAMPVFWNEDQTKRFSFTGLVRAATAPAGGLPGIYAKVKEGRKERILYLNNRLFVGQKSTTPFEHQTLGNAVNEIADFREGRFIYGASTLVAMRRQGDNWKLEIFVESEFETVEAYGPRDHAPTDLQAIDIDGDGDDDIAYLYDVDEHSLTLLVNRGDGEFSSAATSAMALRDVSTGDSLESATLVDLNGDGQPDLLAHGVYGDAWHAPSRR